MRTRIVRLLIASSFGAVVATTAPLLHADDAITQCIAANDKGLDLRKQGKLVDARKALAACAVATCGADIKDTCEKRIAEINGALPTIIFSPKDGAGNDLAGVKASMDGAVLTESLDGRPFTVDPGKHTFKFEVTGQAPVEKDFVLSENEKDRREQIVIGPAPAANPTATAPTTPTQAANTHTPPVSSGPPLKTIGYVVGGAGLVGIVIGSIFGIEAISQNNAANCDANSYCQNPQSRTSAQGSATVSTVGFIAGGVLLAGGVVLVLAAPKESKGAPVTGRWEAGPMIASGTGGLLLRGSW